MPAVFRRRITLTDRERRVVRAIAEAMFERDDCEGAAEDDDRFDRLVGDVDRFISVATKTTRFGLRVALFFVRLAPILFFVRLTTIERLPVAERTRVLARLEKDSWVSLSLAFIGWRTVLTLVYYENELELSAIGYAGAERSRWKRALPVLTPPSMVEIEPVLSSSGVLAAPRLLPPAPLESGVRLRDDVDADHDSQKPQRVANDHEEVA